MPKKNGNGESPTLVRWQLGLRIKGHREKMGKTQSDIALALACHPSTVWRMETGRLPIKPGDIREIALVLDIPQSEAEDMVMMARATTGSRGWSDRYRDVVPDAVGMYAGLEGTASRILSYDPDIVNGVLQIPQYAEEIIGTDTKATPQTLEKRLAFRLQRQTHLLERDEAPDLQFVLGEGALRRGSPTLMKTQLAHLIELSETLDIRVRPFAAGFHPWLQAGSFAILTFPDSGHPSVVYTETHIDARYMETARELTEYAEIFGRLHETSIPIKEFAS